MSTGIEQGSYFSLITYNICRVNEICLKMELDQVNKKSWEQK